jgi:hypothetical protein
MTSPFKASLTLAATTIFCQDCKHSLLPYKHGDFHTDAQCRAPENFYKIHSVVERGTATHVKAFHCRTARADESLCGKEAKWFIAKGE